MTRYWEFLLLLFIAFLICQEGRPEISVNGIVQTTVNESGLPGSVVRINKLSNYNTGPQDFSPVNVYVATPTASTNPATKGYVDALPTGPLVNALSLDRPAFNVTSDGATITCTVSNNAGGSTLTYYFDNQPVVYTVPTNLTLSAGTTNIAQINWISCTPSGMNVGTTRPTGERAIMAVVNVLDATTTQSDGPLTIQRYTDAVELPNERSVISHGAERQRQDGASWESGVALTIVTNVQGAAEDDLYITLSSGQIWQMLLQDFAAITNTDGSFNYYVLNSQSGIYSITNLNQISEDADGDATLDNPAIRFNIEILVFQVSGMAGAVSRIGILLSTGDYGTQDQALADANNYTVSAVSGQFIGVSVRIARITLRRTAAASGTWTAIVTDRRGAQLGICGAGSGANPGANTFPDNLFRIFDDTDPTKQMALDASGITTATTRTYGLPDAAGTIVLDPLVDDLNGNGKSLTNLLSIVFLGSAGTNLTAKHLFENGTNYLSLHMAGATVTNLYPIAIAP